MIIILSNKNDKQAEQTFVEHQRYNIHAAHPIHRPAHFASDTDRMVRRLVGGEVEIRHIAIPRAKLFGLLRHLFLIELLIFVLLYHAFAIAAFGLILLRFLPYYKGLTPVWKKFYSVWSLHILVLLSTIPMYFFGVIVRYIVYRLITGW